MAPSLNDAARLLGRLSEEDRDRPLEFLLAADLGAETDGFGIGALAPRRKDLEPLSAALRRHAGAPVRELSPFQEIESWSGEDLAAAARCLALVALTTARQMVPHLLAGVMEEARRVEVPVVVLVDDMDSVRDPHSLATRAGEEVGRSVPGLRVRLICLGGERFDGPDLDTAVAREAARLQAERATLAAERSRSLTRLRAGQVQALLEDRRAALFQRQAAIEEIGTLVSRGRLASEVLARSEATLWSDRLAVAAAEIRQIRAEPLAPRVLETDLPGEALLTSRMEAAVRGELQARLGTLRGSVCPGLRASLQDLRARLALERDRYTAEVRSALGDAAVVGPSPNADVVGRAEAALDQACESLVRHCLEGVRAPSKLVDVLASYDLLSTREGRRRPESLPLPEIQLGEPDPYPLSEEQRSWQAGRRRSDRDDAGQSEFLAGAREMINYQVVRNHVVSGIAAMLAEAERRAEEQKERARQEWSALVDELVRETFASLEGAVQRERGAVEARSRAVEQAADDLRA